MTLEGVSSPTWSSVLEKIDRHRYLIPKSYKPGMRTDALVYADPEMIELNTRDLSLEQAANVAFLPGIVGRSLAMPDAHQGYGFPIGGVAAMDAEEGVISPGGVGFDINCGVRLVTSTLGIQDVRPQLKELINQLFRAVPSGTGSEGKVHLKGGQIDDVLKGGAQWAVMRGYGFAEDLEHTEESGCFANADPGAVSDHAKKRGSNQVGTLGSGNHFLEVQYIDQIFDEELAAAFHLFPGQVVVLIHSGSRGPGHQVCTDYLRALKPAMAAAGIKLPDRELTCVPIRSPEGQAYLGAMAAAANFAWANRQFMMHWTREVFAGIYGRETHLHLLYDVAHNIAKFEWHTIEGERRRLLVHRKGATRAFPAGHPELAQVFRQTGQPVIIPGSMGTASYVLVGTDRAMEETFGSVCHGAGRVMSRTAAKKGKNARQVEDELMSRGIYVRAASREGVTEEIPEAYKDIDHVVDIVHNAGLAKRVARMKPVGVCKG